MKLFLWMILGFLDEWHMSFGKVDRAILQTIWMFINAVKTDHNVNERKMKYR